MTVDSIAPGQPLPGNFGLVFRIPREEYPPYVQISGNHIAGNQRCGVIGRASNMSLVDNVIVENATRTEPAGRGKRRGWYGVYLLGLPRVGAVSMRWRFSLHLAWPAGSLMSRQILSPKSPSTPPNAFPDHQRGRLAPGGASPTSAGFSGGGRAL